MSLYIRINRQLYKANNDYIFIAVYMKIALEIDVVGCSRLNVQSFFTTTCKGK